MAKTLRSYLAYIGIACAALTLAANVMLYFAAADWLARPPFVVDLINAAYFVFPNALVLIAHALGVGTITRLAATTLCAVAVAWGLVALVKSDAGVPRLASVLTVFVVLSLLSPLAALTFIFSRF